MNEYTTATIPPPKEATMVCPAALAANRHWLPVTPKVLPELKASHPLLIMNEALPNLHLFLHFCTV